jgi:DNA recombination protein RmuC
MIELWGESYALNDPRVIAALAGGALILLVLVLLFLAVLRAGRSVRAVEPLAYHLASLGHRVENLSAAQHQLSGGLTRVTEAQAVSQKQMLGLMEERLAGVTQTMAENLQGSARRTAQSLGDLQQRLAAIDKAQANIEKLSGDVLTLQDILSNKQTRGAFGEIQLGDIVRRALPPDAYTLQATLSNGRRADCLVHLPYPPGPIAIDAKFPLEAYEALRAAKTEREIADAQRLMRAALRAHIRDIKERYIIDGETADGALLFLPSEAVYAELHANFGDVVREGFAARVWIVSPTTCMATLNTMRAVLKDARMREQAGAIRRELGALYADVDRLSERVANLDRHFSQAAKDIDEIKISAEKAGRRAKRLDAFDFETLPEEGEARVVPLPKQAP